jgi:NAD-dependent DNA ligase
MSLLDNYKEDPYEVISTISLKDLVKLITDANNQYYNYDNPLMTDQEYDLLKEELEKRNPKHKLLTQIAHETHSKDKVKLPFYMGSMDKIKPGTGLIDKWIKKFKGSYILSDKLDGSSGLLVLRNDGKHMLFTRGNGKIGTNISSLLTHMKGIPDLKMNLVVRGELLISKEVYEKNKDEYVNARAMINGLVGKKSITKKEIKNITFVAYEVVDPFDTIENQMKLLKKLKFETVEHKLVKKIDEEYLSSYFKKRKQESKYDIDGIIITDNGKHIRNKTKNPKYAFAFKELLEDQIMDTEITDIEWRVSKDGLIKPRIHIKPTIIGGIKITHVTGHNAKNVVDSGLGIGAKVKLTRAGEVIPYILEVTKKVKPTLPKIPYVWNETKVDFIVDENNLSEAVNYDILVKNITYFFKKMNIKYVDESIVKKMIDVGLDNINSIINASVDDLMEIEGFQEKMATKIHTNIQKSIKDVELSKVMTASNLFGHGIGSKKLSLIINKNPNILQLKLSKQAFIDKIIEIDGFDTKTATQFVDNIGKFKDFLNKNKKIQIKIVKKTTKKNGKFKDKKFVFTGFRDKELEAYIEKEGGTLSTSVSSNTNYVLTNDKDSTSSKVTKAKDLGIELFLKDEFVKKFKVKFDKDI